ncbi:Proteinaceous RNase P 1, chloroplastic/mitochondrial [Vitis vinifera]|uniref:Proteinaceous RNase P 1, chloroplastic/mitochondrial n=1 Tax=Vitis vinifera TaxID=29760 RepID=A0A438BXM4_VITVI|nr:Proteinaceous RNase P 1, chloroplastic/mitochondrial [Vitis vinifera]
MPLKICHRKQYKLLVDKVTLLYEFLLLIKVGSAASHYCFLHWLVAIELCYRLLSLTGFVMGDIKGQVIHKTIASQILTNLEGELIQEWLQRHGPFDAVVDGANVSLINQKSFSFFELNSVVNRLRQISPSKRLPLVILHRSRVTGGPAQNPNNEKLIQSWKKSGALYATPAGSNDDW